MGLVTTYNYSITIQNVTGGPIKFVGFAADQPCVTFLPPLLNLTLPAYGGPGLLLPTQTRTLNLQVQKTAPCPGTNTFHLSTFDTNLIACCSTKVTLPPYKCPTIISPYGGSAVLINTPVLARAIALGPCDLRWVKFYDGTIFLGDAAPNPVSGAFELTLTNLPAGIHLLTAVSELDSGTTETGEIQSSDPVELTVLDPGPNPDQLRLPPIFSMGVSGSSVLINLFTEVGEQYEIQYTTNLSTGPWKTLQTISGVGTMVDHHGFRDQRLQPLLPRRATAPNRPLNLN